MMTAEDKDDSDEDDDEDGAATRWWLEVMEAATGVWVARVSVGVGDRRDNEQYFF